MDLWVITLGLAAILGMVGLVLIYFLRGALDSEDAIRIDKLPADEPDQKM